MQQTDFLEKVKQIATQLSESNIPYQYIETTALAIQGVPIPHQNEIHILIQWDLLEAVYDLFLPYSPTPLNKNKQSADFTIEDEGFIISISCKFNTTVKTDPYRIKVDLDDLGIWCYSLYAEIYNDDYKLKKEIHEFLSTKQSEMNTTNEVAWNQNNYQALVNRFGSPEDAAKKIIDNPEWRLHPFKKYLKDVSGKKVIHLLGSNGVKGVALALLGADVTVVDFSKENKKFAQELAEHSGVKLDYIVSDVLSLPELNCKFDVVLMELGVLHYFVDLIPLAKLIRSLLGENGRFILHEFHPISTKLITSSGKKHRISGNYFDPSIHAQEVAFSKHMPENNQQTLSKVYQRYWTLGEIITMFASVGLYVEVLEEEPNHKMHDVGLPKTFTMVIK